MFWTKCCAMICMLLSIMACTFAPLALSSKGANPKKKEYEEPEALTDWHLLGGNARRNAQFNTPPPWPIADTPLWTADNSLRLIQLLDDYLPKVVESKRKEQLPLIPGGFALSGSDEGVPSLIGRSEEIGRFIIENGGLQWGIRPLNVVRKGQERLEKEHGKWVSATADALEKQGNLAAFFENTLAFSLSRDGSQVYIILDVPALADINLKPPGSPPAYEKFNSLSAAKLSSGKIKWALGDTNPHLRLEKPNEFTDSFFLGAPLPWNWELYVLNEKNQDIRLVCLDPDDGKLLWLEKLTQARVPLSKDFSRRIHGAFVSYHKGILVCPTNDAEVFGFDLKKRKIIWKHEYRDKKKAPASFLAEWKVPKAAISDGRVFLTPADHGQIHCLTLADGKHQWSKDRGDDVYLACVRQGQAVLVGAKKGRALSIEDGKELWSVETGIPSGVGVLCKHCYYLPLAAGSANGKPEICMIDLDKGEVEERKELKETPGNILIWDNKWIMQGPTKLSCYNRAE